MSGLCLVSRLKEASRRRPAPPPTRRPLPLSPSSSLQAALSHHSDVCALFAPSASLPSGEPSATPTSTPSADPLPAGPSGWQASTPVFASIAAPRCAELLLTVAEALGREAALRERICRMLRPVAAADADADAGDGGMSSAGAVPAPLLAALQSAGCTPAAGSWSGEDAAGLAPAGAGGGKGAGGTRQQLCTLLICYLSCWLSSPFLDEERCRTALEGLAEDMAGF